MSGSTAATLVLTEDWDVMVAAQLLGHASVTTTSKYLDEQPGELRWRSTPPLTPVNP
jgi:site-specific recombinase XerD